MSLGLRGEAEALHLPRRAFHLLAHQLFCLALQEQGVSRDLVWRILSRAHCFSSLERADMDALIEHMLAQEYLREVDELLLVGPKGESSYLGSSWRRLFAVFDTAPMYEVYDGKAQVGTLDAAFVEALQVPFLFVLGARRWKAHRVDVKARAVHVRRAADGEAPKWVSFGGPDVPYETAQEVGRLLHSAECPSFLDEEGRAAFEREVERASGIPWRPGSVVALVSRSGQSAVFTYAGDRRNRALGRLLMSRGVTKATSDYRRVEFKVPPEAAQLVAGIIRGTFQEFRHAKLEEDDLLRVLANGQHSWPFSPFARCLPENLLTRSLAERVLDAPGLLSTLRTAELNVVESENPPARDEGRAR